MTTTWRVVLGIVVIVVLASGAAYVFSKRAPAVPQHDGWLTATAIGGGSFLYPPSLGFTYVTPLEWPPKVTIKKGLLSCSPTKPEESPMVMTQWRTIGRESYCVSLSRGAAAGSVYDEYTYATKRGDEVITLVFTMQLPQCMNYEKPQQAACFAEQKRFAPDALAASIVRTVTLP